MHELDSFKIQAKLLLPVQ